MERLRDRVNNYEIGDLRGRWFVCVCERERERVCVLFGENGFVELKTDILFLCFGFVNGLALDNRIRCLFAIFLLPLFFFSF